MKTKKTSRVASFKEFKSTKNFDLEPGSLYQVKSVGKEIQKAKYFGPMYFISLSGKDTVVAVEDTVILCLETPKKIVLGNRITGLEQRWCTKFLIGEQIGRWITTASPMDYSRYLFEIYHWLVKVK